MKFLNSNVSGLQAMGEAEILAAQGQRQIVAELARLAKAAFRLVPSMLTQRRATPRRS